MPFQITLEPAGEDTYFQTRCGGVRVSYMMISNRDAGLRQKKAEAINCVVLVEASRRKFAPGDHLVNDDRRRSSVRRLCPYSYL